MKPLSVGNVVSAGLRIYRDNFKKYYRLALIASLWSWIPIYGWAKFCAIQGLIARLAYKEIIEQPESVSDANRYVKGRLWSYLGAAILVFLIFTAAYIGGAIIIAILAGASAVILRSIFNTALGDSGAVIALIIYVILVLVSLVLFIGYLTRLYASYCVSELSLSVEENVNASAALKRSRELTKGYLRNLLLVILTASLVSLPLWSLILTVQILPEFIQYNLALPSTVFTVLQLIFNSIVSALIIPFWQAVKAVIYCDLRVRREGMGIDLRK